MMEMKTNAEIFDLLSIFVLSSVDSNFDMLMCILFYVESNFESFLCL